MTRSTTTTFAEAAIVTATQIVRNFGKYKDIAQNQPVAITSSGRDSLVLLSASEYARLKALDDRVSLHPNDLPDDMKAQLLSTEEYQPMNNNQNV